MQRTPSGTRDQATNLISPSFFTSFSVSGWFDSRRSSKGGCGADNKTPAAAER